MTRTWEEQRRRDNKIGKTLCIISTILFITLIAMPILLIPPAFFEGVRFNIFGVSYLNLSLQSSSATQKAEYLDTANEFYSQWTGNPDWLFHSPILDWNDANFNLADLREFLNPLIRLEQSITSGNYSEGEYDDYEDGLKLYDEKLTILKDRVILIANMWVFGGSRLKVIAFFAWCFLGLACSVIGLVGLGHLD